MALEFTLRQARYLVAAVEAGSMAAASRDLHVSASAVSLAITELERTLDSPLIIRVPHRPLALTPAGRRLIGDMRRLVAAAHEIAAKSIDEAHGEAGRLDVGCFTTLAPLLAPRMIAATVEHHPTVDLRLSELPAVELQQAVLDGNIELGILYDDGDLHPELERSRLTVVEPYILVWEDHRVARQETVHLCDLSDDPMVMLDLPPSRDLFGTILSNAGITPSITRISKSFETVRSLVARKQGWSMLIQRPSIDVSYEGLPLKCLPIADLVRHIGVVAVWPRSAHLTRRGELFVELCHRQLN